MHYMIHNLSLEPGKELVEVKGKDEGSGPTEAFCWVWLRWTPHSVIVNLRDKKDSTVTGWGALIRFSQEGF